MTKIIYRALPFWKNWRFRVLCVFTSSLLVWVVLIAYLMLLRLNSEPLQPLLLYLRWAREATLVSLFYFVPLASLLPAETQIRFGWAFVALSLAWGVLALKAIFMIWLWELLDHQPKTLPFVLCYFAYILGVAIAYFSLFWLRIKSVSTLAAL